MLDRAGKPMVKHIVLSSMPVVPDIIFDLLQFIGPEEVSRHRETFNTETAGTCTLQEF